MRRLVSEVSISAWWLVPAAFKELAAEILSEGTSVQGLATPVTMLARSSHQPSANAGQERKKVFGPPSWSVSRGEAADVVTDRLKVSEAPIRIGGSRKGNHAANRDERNRGTNADEMQEIHGLVISRVAVEAGKLKVGTGASFR